MERRVISSGSAWEERYGYSRAVVAGGRVHVSGTAPIMPGDAEPPAEAYGQARRCLESLGAALEEAGATAADLVRTRTFVTDRQLITDVMRAPGDDLAEANGYELESRINPELMQSVLEIATPVCRTAADVEAELRKLRGFVCDLARERGMRVGSAGTHPFSLFERQRITARDRYRNLVDQMQYVARRELIFGMHVHVAVDDPEKAIQVVNGLLVQVPMLLALSANSPFWRGEPTGLSSSRQMVFAAFPRSGPPPRS